jgi:hypothetical protein
MNTNSHSARLAMLSLLAAALLLGVTNRAPGMAATEDPPKVESVNAERNQPPELVPLTLVITGNGKPVAQAEVRISFPAESGGETTLRTNERGEAVFKTDFKGNARMRVIASGWQSLMKEVAFKGAAQRLPINLSAFE